LVVTVSLLGIVSVVLFSSFLSVQKSEAYVQGRATSLDEMRVTMSRMTRELRQGSAFETTPSESDLEIRTYVNGVVRDVRYTAAGSTLTRTVDGGAGVVVGRGLVSTAIFQYAPDTTNPQLVTITLQVEPTNAPDTTVTLDSEVRLRNLTEAQ
jgi:hypothetical protein